MDKLKQELQQQIKTKQENYINQKTKKNFIYPL